MALGGSKQRALLALLLLHANRVVSRDRLIDELWDGSPPETASTALQVHVSGLRKALGHDAIVTQAPGYMIKVEPGALDLKRFELLVREAHGKEAEAAAEGLREALALWRGPPFADLGDFARAERAQLEEQRASALEQRVEADLELGLHAELVPELEALVREEPLRERRRAQLMLALYRSGRQADALDTYRSGRKRLADELGLEPGGELRQLEKAILEHDPALAPPPAPQRREPTAEERRLRLLGRSRLAVVVGALLLAGALAGIIIAVTGGSDAVVVEPNSVAVVNPKTGRVVADVPIGGRPVAIAVGSGGVWVANADKQTIVRIDPKSKKVVTTIGLGTDVSDVAVGFGSIWVAGGNGGTLTRIDPSLNAPEAPVDLGGGEELVPQPVFLVATGAGSVWVTRGNKLLRIDPETNEARTWLGVDRPQGLAAGAGAVWVAQENEHVLRIDATTPKITAEEDLSELPQFPVLYGGSLWLIGYGENPHVWHLDSTTLTPQTAIPFRRNGYPFELTGGTRALWTVGPNTGVLWRIDPATELATRVVRVGHHPISVAAGEGAVWVGTQEEQVR
ncbi:MAG: winged helix-turn-helix domain-containing protein [Actinomycetota bacterium]|nr:winged helix-turn-helix domain-containing protein [Actinomycetota bacterium]